MQIPGEKPGIPWGDERRVYWSEISQLQPAGPACCSNYQGIIPRP